MAGVSCTAFPFMASVCDVPEHTSHGFPPFIRHRWRAIAVSSADVIRVRIIDATRPCPATGVLQRGPKAGVVRQGRMRSQIGAQGTECQNPRAFLRRETALRFPDQVNARFEAIAIDMNSDEVAVHDFADRSARQSFRADVPDARAGGDPENRASVSSATCFPNGRCFSAPVTW